MAVIDYRIVGQVILARQLNGQSADPPLVGGTWIETRTSYTLFFVFGMLNVSLNVYYSKLQHAYEMRFFFLILAHCFHFPRVLSFGASPL